MHGFQDNKNNYVMRLLIGLLFITVLGPFVSVRAQETCSDIVSYIASNLQVKYAVVENPKVTEPLVFNVSVQLYNSGNGSISAAGSWHIYFHHIRLVEPQSIIPDGVVIDDVKVKIEHVNGDLHRLSPLPDFLGLLPGRSIIVRFQAGDWEVSKSDVMPNWYVASDNSDVSPQIIRSTAGESLDFVTEFTTKEQWKRLPSDTFDPYTPEVRLDIDKVPEIETADREVIPTPFQISIDWSRRVNILTHGWVIIDDTLLRNEIKFLAEKTGLAVVSADGSPCNHYIHLENTTSITPYSANESYEVLISSVQQTIHIRGATPAGVFYGVQTLLSLMETSEWPGELGDGLVVDRPRFEHRGMHVDVGRNFHTVADMERIMNVMAQYKMNRLHFHLTDDEGWRLEIPALPELTEVGGRRCHDLNELKCILPLLGSGPTQSNAGSGYFTVNQYRGLLQFAKDRHIQVIPEFDMPGHSHAAIKSMEARYHNYKDDNLTLAEEFLLRDHNDTSQYLSIQYYTDNAINPCIESTYRFISVLVRSVKEMHEDIQPLQIIHLGGDEAPHNAYQNSSSCAEFFANGTDLEHYFVHRSSEIAAMEGLDVAFWEDGLYGDHAVMDRSEFRPQNVYTNVWSNVWEWGNGGRAYEFANNNYKVILSHATHLYLDFPSEPDPLERGYYWATRHIPIKKTFGYLPDSVYRNIDLDTDRMGYPLNSTVICRQSACPELVESQRPNIIGIQGQLWSETVRTSEQLDYNIFPRILAVAERAWHKALWEDETDLDKQKQDLNTDWARFANTLGRKELRRLGELGVKYRIPVAGARINKDTGALEWTAGFPGLPARYTTSLETGNWTDLNPRTPVYLWDRKAYIKIGSADSSRYSRIVSPTPTDPPVTAGSCRLQRKIFTLISALFFIFI